MIQFVLMNNIDSVAWFASKEAAERDMEARLAAGEEGEFWINAVRGNQ